MKPNGCPEMSSHGSDGHGGFWLSAASDDHITPGGENHEGFDIGLVLRLLCGPSVCEIGCGLARHAGTFEDYTGLDVNHRRIAASERRHPGREFKLVGFDDPYPPAVCYLFCSVLLHVRDEHLASVAGRVKGTKTVICEVMNPRRRDGIVNFHRAPADYAVFGKAMRFSLPYERYGDVFTFLVFDA